MAGRRRERACSVIGIAMLSAVSGYKISRRIHGNSISMHHFHELIEDEKKDDSKPRPPGLRPKPKAPRPKPKKPEDPLCALEKHALWEAEFQGKWKSNKMSHLVLEVSAKRRSPCPFSAPNRLRSCYSSYQLCTPTASKLQGLRLLTREATTCWNTL